MNIIIGATYLIMTMYTYFLRNLSPVDSISSMIHFGPTIQPIRIVEIMEIFQLCDPYLNKDMMIVDDLLHPCQQIWKRYGNDNPQKLAAYAAQLKEFFK